MIDARELRIGNWIYSPIHKKNGKLVAIEIGERPIVDIGVERKFTTSFSGCDCLQPISLSPDILIKAGFMNLLDENDKPSREWRLNSVTLFLGFDFVHLHRFNQWVYNYAWTGEKAPVCEYVHQLQNLYYALTNQELQINF